jgi:hypothetical protein
MKILGILLLAIIPCSVVSDSVTITNWTVTDFITEDSNVTAIVYMGETVTWNGVAPNDTYQFQDEEDFLGCNFTNATLLEEDANSTITFASWDLRKIKPRAPLFYGSMDGCDDGDKIKIVLKPKQFEGSQEHPCLEDDGEPFVVLQNGKGKKWAKGKGKCRQKCRRTEKCFGFQFSIVENDPDLKPKFNRTCSLFDYYPDYDSDYNMTEAGDKKQVCWRVKYNNTVGDSN